MRAPHRTRLRRGLVYLLLVAGLLGTFAFGNRTYRSFVVLLSAYQVGAPAVSSVRPWMTVSYVAVTYRVPLGEFLAALDLPADTAPDSVLYDIALDRDIERIPMVALVQSAIAELGIAQGDATPGLTDGSDGLANAFLAALLTYGYPALAVVLLLGAIGAPVPTGIATVLAGSLAATGAMSWPVAMVVAIIASVAGDLVGYGIGRLAGEGFVTRHGYLIGYAGHRKQRVEWLFRRWGGATVLLTRTLVSHLSSLASVLAGLSRYGMAMFLIYATTGRLIWTSAYLGLGYFVGNDLAAASGFLGNLTGLVVVLAITLAASAQLVRSRRQQRVNMGPVD